MDFNHNGEDPSNYVNKAKKQAKRLLQLTKKTENKLLAVPSLMEAQNVIAKINGFPNWHSLDSYVSNKNKKINETSIPIQGGNYLLNKDEYNKESYGVNYRVTEDGCESVFNLKIDCKSYEMISFFKEIIKQLKFASSLGFHDINFHFIHNNSKVEMDGYNVLNGGEKYLEKIEINQHNACAINLIIKTDRKSFNEKYIGSIDIEDIHIKLGLAIVKCFKVFNPISLKNYQSIFNKFSLWRVENRVELDVEKDRRYKFLTNNNLLSSAIFALNYILENKINCEIKFSLDGLLNFAFENNRAPSFIKENIMKNLYEQEVCLDIANHKDIDNTGFAFYNILSKSINYIDLSLNKKTTSVSGIFYQNKDRHNSANELMVYAIADRHLGEFNNGVRTGILAKDYNAEYLFKVLGSKVSHKVVKLGFNGGLKLPNPLVLPLGVNCFTDDNVIRLSNLMLRALNFNFDDDKTQTVFRTFLRSVNSHVKKSDSLFSDYEPRLVKENEYNQIVSFLNTLNIKKDEISTIQVIRLLKLKKRNDLARLLQSEYTPTIHDLFETVDKISNNGFNDLILQNLNKEDLKIFIMNDSNREKILSLLKKMKALFDNERVCYDFEDDVSLYILNISSNNIHQEYLSEYALYVMDMFISRSAAKIEKQNSGSFQIKNYMKEFNDHFNDVLMCKENSGFMLVLPEFSKFDVNVTRQLISYIRETRLHNHSCLYSTSDGLFNNTDLLSFTTCMFMNINLDSLAYISDYLDINDSFKNNPIVRYESKKEHNWITLDFNMNGKSLSLLRFNKPN